MIELEKPVRQYGPPELDGRLAERLHIRANATIQAFGLRRHCAGAQPVGL
jgi:hypothetical protein